MFKSQGQRDTGGGKTTLEARLEFKNSDRKSLIVPPT